MAKRFPAYIVFFSLSGQRASQLASHSHSHTIRQLRLHCLAQGHFRTQTGLAGDQTLNLGFNGCPTLHQSLQSQKFDWSKKKQVVSMSSEQKIKRKGWSRMAQTVCCLLEGISGCPCGIHCPQETKAWCWAALCDCEVGWQRWRRSMS